MTLIILYFGDEYIGKVNKSHMPMYAESRYIGEVIEYVIPMYLKLAKSRGCIGANLMAFIPMYFNNKR